MKDNMKGEFRTIESETWIQEQEENLRKDFQSNFVNNVILAAEKKINISNPADKGCIIYTDNDGKEISRDYGNQNITLTKDQIPPYNQKYIIGFDPITDNSTSKAGFMQVIPNSQIFTTIEQLLNYAQYKIKDNYMYQGIKNSIEQGYKLVKDGK